MLVDVQGQAQMVNLPFSIRSRVQAALFAPMPIAPLVYFRIAFGALMLIEVWRYFDHNWIWRYYIQPQVFFTYYGFDWVRPWPGDLMYTHFHVMGVLAFCIMIGLAYRLVMPLFFLAFTYIFLLDQTNYLNHFYLISLISFLMIFIPAHRALSVDALLHTSLHPPAPSKRACLPRTPFAWRGRESAPTNSSPLPEGEGLGVRVIPAWTLNILLFQISVVYFFGGIAKLNGDWLRGQPMRMWLADRTDFPLIGHLFTEEWMVYAFSYGGLLLDLLAVPGLLWRRTRWPAVIVLVLFHLANVQLFNIGIFPWFMIATMPLFMPAHWWGRLPEVSAAIMQSLSLRRQRLQPSAAETPNPPPSRVFGYRLTAGLLAVYCVLQILIPLRHFLYPGDVAWTEDGHRFSWRMKLNDKVDDSTFIVRHPETSSSWEVYPEDYLTHRQASKLGTEPDMILQFAHFLARELESQGWDNVEIYGQVYVAMNGRGYRQLVNPAVDLAAQPRTGLHYAWLLPDGG
jgi:hypothetical protein